MNGAVRGGATHRWLAAYPDDVNWRAPIPARSLPDLWDEAARRFADKPCIDFLDKRYTYAEVGRLIDRAAKGLQKLGVGPGTKVGLFLPNTPYFVILYFATLKAGATVVNYNPLYAEREILHQIEDSETDIMVTLDLRVLLGKLDPLLAKSRLKTVIVCPMAAILPFPKNLLFPIARRKDVASVPSDGRHIRFADLIANDGRVEWQAIDPAGTIALLQYTGGTTGVPKGAMLTHANVTANAEQLRLWAPGVTPGQERILGVLPLFHVFAMTVVMTHGVLNGCEMVLLPRFELDKLLGVIQRKRPTVFVGVPTLYGAINTHPEAAHTDLRSLRYCLSGGAPLPVEVKHAFERLTGCTLVEGYGLSESSPVATCNPFKGANKPGSIGLPLPGTTVEIVSLDGDDRVMGVGERGEITIRGPQVMQGYWKRPEETERVLRGGRLHTGDVGTMDEDGYVFVVDRLKELILAGGYNVYPRNVEEAIYMHPAIAECAVIGVPDSYRGQTVKAFLVLRQGMSLDAESLKAFLADKLSPIEMPRQVEVRASLPKTAIGKILKKTLLAEEEERRKSA